MAEQCTVAEDMSSRVQKIRGAKEWIEVEGDIDRLVKPIFC